MKIGFYGSSLCHAVSNKEAERYAYSSYIAKLQKHYNAEVCHLGATGCGFWDVILIQYKELLANPPDVAVFIWPTNRTLFDRKFRCIHEMSTYEGTRLQLFNTELWRAAKLFYEQLFDKEKDVLEFTSALHYFDNVMLSQLKDIKIIHLWEHGVLDNLNPDLSNAKFIEDAVFPHSWKHGMEIKGSLLGISTAGQWPRRPTLEKVLVRDPRCNHLEGDTKNKMMFELLVKAIDNYANDVTIDIQDDIVKFYNDMLKN